MPHVKPIAREALEEYEPFFQVAEQMIWSKRVFFRPARMQFPSVFPPSRFDVRIR